MLIKFWYTSISLKVDICKSNSKETILFLFQTA